MDVFNDKDVPTILYNHHPSHHDRNIANDFLHTIGHRDVSPGSDEC